MHKFQSLIQITSGSEQGAEIARIINYGRIVPSEITVGLLDKVMMAHRHSHNRFMIDGFPRNLENWRAWNSQLGTHSHTLTHLHSHTLPHTVIPTQHSHLYTRTLSLTHNTHSHQHHQGTRWMWRVCCFLNAARRRWRRGYCGGGKHREERMTH